MKQKLAVLQKGIIKHLPTDKQEVFELLNDLDTLNEKYLEWVKNNVYFLFRIEHYGKFRLNSDYDELIKTEHKHILSPKRGNDKYVRLLETKLKKFNKLLPDKSYFNPKDRKPQKTPMFYVVMTYDPTKYSIDEAWTSVGKDTNRFRSALSKYFDCDVSICRTWENHKSGYPHINLVVYLSKSKCSVCNNPNLKIADRKDLTYYCDVCDDFYSVDNVTIQDHNISCFFHNSKWRISCKRDLEKYWDCGFIDIQALSLVKRYTLEDLPGSAEERHQEKSILSLSHLFKYLTKDLREDPDPKYVQLNALLWITRSRAFSLSGIFLKKIGYITMRDIINEFISPYIITQTKNVKIVFSGVFPGCVMSCCSKNGGSPPPNCPYYRWNDREVDICPYDDNRKGKPKNSLAYDSSSAGRKYCEWSILTDKQAKDLYNRGVDPGVSKVGGWVQYGYKMYSSV